MAVVFAVGHYYNLRGLNGGCVAPVYLNQKSDPENGRLCGL